MYLDQENMRATKERDNLYASPSVRNIEISDIAPIERLAFASIKYLFTNDSLAESRRAYMSAMLGPNHFITSYAIYDDVVPNSNKDTDILIVGGEDHRRLGALMRVNNLLFLRKPKICLSEKADVDKIVYLLQSGFDAVINPATTAPLEACHQIAAIWARYLQPNTDFRKRGDFLDALHQVPFYDALSKQERKVFELLFGRVGQVVTCSQLQEAASLDHAPVTNNHLRGLICSIRLRLLDGWTISCRRGEGYMLEK